jgi:hypothetical protein
MKRVCGTSCFRTTRTIGCQLRHAIARPFFQESVVSNCTNMTRFARVVLNASRPAYTSDNYVVPVGCAQFPARQELVDLGVTRRLRPSGSANREVDANGQPRLAT